MILDIVVVAIFALGAFAGYKKGLVGVLVGFISLILAILFAFFLQAPVADYISNNTQLGTTLNQSMTEGINNSINTSNQENQNGFYALIAKTVTNSQVDNYTTEQIAKLGTDFVIKGISFIIIFVVVYLICYIIQMILNLAFSLPILNILNKTGGLAVGFIKGFVTISLMLMIVYFLSSMPLFNSLYEMISNSTITKILYENNILVGLIKSNLKI